MSDSRNNRTSFHAARGLAAMIRDIQHAIDKLQGMLNDMRVRLAALQGWRAATAPASPTTLEAKTAQLAKMASEESLRSHADRVSMMVWASGTDKLCTYFNPAWCGYTGRTLEEELGDGWAQGVHPDDVEACVESYVRAFDAREPFRLEYRLRRADGQYGWIVDQGMPRYAPDGRFTGYVGSAIDIPIPSCT